MRHQVKDAGGKCTHTQGEEHIAELADCGVRQHPLDVVLHEGDRCREERSNRADDGNHRHRLGRHLIDEVAARDHVDAGGYHRSRMDESADRCRAFHSVGQPDVQRNLRRFPRGTHEQRQRDGDKDRVADVVTSGHDAFANGFANPGELERAE